MREKSKHFQEVVLKKVFDLVGCENSKTMEIVGMSMVKEKTRQKQIKNLL